jgi:hypothetical protein
MSFVAVAARGDGGPQARSVFEKFELPMLDLSI